LVDFHDFPNEEYESRYVRTKQSLAEKNIDALIVTTEVNYIYYTGHTATDWIPHWMWQSSKAYPFIFILPRDGDPIVVVHQAEKTAAKNCSWISDVRIHRGYPFSISCVEDVIMELGLTKGIIGWELGPETRLGIPQNEFDKLRTTFPETEFVDASNVILQSRLIKSPEEIRRIRKANEITMNALEHFYEAARFGITEKEAARLINQFMLDEGADRCQYYVTYQVTPELPPMFRSRPLGRVFAKSECVYLDFGASYKGYCADINRMFTFSSATKEMIETHEDLLYVEEQMIDSIKPGIEISEVYQAYKSALEKKGITGMDYGRAGHGVGIEVTEPPSLGSSDSTVLQEGMTITVEPRIVESYGYFTVEDAVLVTSNGRELLTPGPRDLHVIS